MPRWKPSGAPLRAGSMTRRFTCRSSPAAIAARRPRAHHWRAECDAVAVGIGTALADDPQLTARLPEPAGRAGPDIRQPRRVVFDSLARLGTDSKLVRDAGQVPLTVVVSRAAPRA